MSFLHRLKLPVAAAALASIGFLGVAAADVSAELAPPTHATCTTPLMLRSIELVRTTNGPAILVSGIKPHDDTRVVLLAEDVDYVQAPDTGTTASSAAAAPAPSARSPSPRCCRSTVHVGIYGIAIGSRTFDLGSGDRAGHILTTHATTRWAPAARRRRPPDIPARDDGVLVLAPQTGQMWPRSGGRTAQPTGRTRT